MSTPTSPNDSPFESPVTQSVPAAIDRRSFFMRNAVIGASGGVNGKNLDARSLCRTGDEGSRCTEAGARFVSRPGGREEVEGSRDDRGG